MKKSLISLGVGVLSVAATFAQSVVVSSELQMASTPRFTTNALGQPVLSWVERTPEQQTSFYYVVSSDGGKTFGEKIQVPIPLDVSVHAEGMPKIAFKGDGSSIAVLFERKRSTPEAPRASILQYMLSADGGRTWSVPTYIHSDTIIGKGRSFGDIIRLPNGELAAAWLGEGQPNKGRPVRFALTSQGKGFGKEITVEDEACQCCRTNLFVDKQGNIHLFYRELYADGTRDIGHVVSVDGGRTFGKSELVYRNAWKIAACPHTGPSAAQVGAQVQVAWYSGAEKDEKIQVRALSSQQVIIELKATNVRHPQLSGTPEGSSVLVWDENVELTNDQRPYTNKIGLKVAHPNGKVQTQYLSTTDTDCTYPVVITTSTRALIAFEERTPNGLSRIKLKSIDLKTVVTE
jgi:hypothetical protein